MLQLSSGQTYVDVCPLLLPFNGSSDGSYSQPVAVQRNLVVFGKNFPVSGLTLFSFFFIPVFVHGGLAVNMAAHTLMLVCCNLQL